MLSKVERKDKNITIWTNIENLGGIKSFFAGQISQLLSKHLERNTVVPVSSSREFYCKRFFNKLPLLLHFSALLPTIA